jgi:hypothetical protein
MKTRLVNGVKHCLFDNVAEFRDYHDSVALVSDWRHSNKGDWILTDDERVCQILHLGVMKKSDRKKETTFIRTIIGSFVCSPNVKLEGPMRTNMHTFSKEGKSPSVRRRERKNATNSEFLFAKYVAKGDDVVDAYMKAFPSNNKKYSERESKLLLKTERMRSLIREEIDKHLSEAEITPKYLLEEMRDIIDKKESSDRDKISAVTTLMKISGMMDTEKKSESLTLFQGFTKEQLNAIQEPKNKKLLEAKRDIKK